MRVKYYDAKTHSFKNGVLHQKQNGGHYMTEDNSSNFTWEYYLSPGWVDIHTHIFDGFGLFGINADEIGWKHGSCMVVDAGTVGDFTIEGFRKYVEPTINTGFKLFICISPIGVIFHHEYNALEYLNVDRTVKIINQNRDIVSGVKVRIGSEVIRHEGLEPLKLAALAARKTNLPLMVHVGGVPPYFKEIVPFLEKGDIITHIFNGRGEGIWNPDGTPTKALERAIDKGVILDVGHGGSSFDFEVYQKAVRHLDVPYIVSSDIHKSSLYEGAVSMDRVMSKLYNMGMSLESLMHSVTSYPAQAIGLDGWCDMDNINNATLFSIVDQTIEYKDTNPKSQAFHKAIKPEAVILNGTLKEIPIESR